MRLTDKEIYSLMKQNIVSFTATCDDTGATVTAKLYPDFTLHVTISGAANGKIVTVNTPFGFKLVDLMCIATGTVTTGTLTAKNSTDAITSAVVVTTDKVITRTTLIDDEYYEFTAGDNDLKLVVATGSGDMECIAILDILPT